MAEREWSESVPRRRPLMRINLSRNKSDGGNSPMKSSAATGGLMSLWGVLCRKEGKKRRKKRRCGKPSGNQADRETGSYPVCLPQRALISQGNFCAICSCMPLPRECSTTELRQQDRGRKRPGRDGGRNLPQGAARCKDIGVATDDAKL